MKKYVINVGRDVLNFSMILILIIAGTTFFVGIFIGKFFTGLFMAFAVIITGAMGLFSMYLLLDIRDLLYEINERNN